MKKLDAQEQPLSKIFCDEYVFKIPPYQRPYSWRTEEAGELFDDLITFMEAKPGSIDEVPPYFLGSIVLIKAEESPDSEIVDGQQRLTTLTLLLSAIRARANDQLARQLSGLIYESGNDVLGTTDRFRLRLRDRDKDFFEKYVQRGDGFNQLLNLKDLKSDSQKRLRDNAELFATKLANMSQDELKNLARFIATRCYLVVVATPDLDSAYRIFSVLNTRGLDLSATDILKARIIGKIVDEKKEYTDKWEDLEEELGRDAFNDLFGHVRMVYRKAKPQGTLLAEFESHVVATMTPQELIKDVLQPMAEAYEKLLDAQYSQDEEVKKINSHMYWLRRLEFRDWVPPALAFLASPSKSLDVVTKFFADLERLAYGMLVTRAGSNERIDRFSKLTGAIQSKANLDAETSVLQLTPGEQYKAYAALSGPFYETLSARARATILLRLDALLSGGGASYEYDRVTVEHVLPQTPASDSAWLQSFPNTESRLKAVHCLGNLALLTRNKNSAASNYEFGKKKIAYFAKGGISPFQLTTQVLTYSDWTEEIVNLRQAQLLSSLEEHWRLQDRELPELEHESELEYLVDETWVNDVVEAMRRIGKPAHLKMIYEHVESIRRSGNRSIPKSIRSIIRRTLGDHSTNSEHYKGRHPLFYMPIGKGSGIWTLVNNANQKIR